MTHNTLILSLFILLAAVQIYVPMAMIIERETVLEYGKTYKFRTQPVDPNDPLRGKYITLGFEDDYITIPGDSSFSEGQEVFVTLEENDLGFAVIKKIEHEIPLGNIDYVKAKISYVNFLDDTSRIYIQYTFDRYYMEEHKAPKAEEAYVESARDSNSVSWALVKIKGGEAVLEDVMIDGISIDEKATTNTTE